jgi:hypothetical protein
MLLIAVLGAEVTAGSSGARSDALPVRTWLTTADPDSGLSPQPDGSFEPDDAQNTRTITVDDAVTYQQADGFGAAMSGASGAASVW